MPALEQPDLESDNDKLADLPDLIPGEQILREAMAMDAGMTYARNILFNPSEYFLNDRIDTMHMNFRREPFGVPTTPLEFASLPPTFDHLLDFAPISHGDNNDNNRTVQRNTTNDAKKRQTEKKTEKGITRPPKYTTATSTRPPSRKFVTNKQRHPRQSYTIEPGQDMFVCDSGGRKYPTVTERAWTIVGGEPGLTTTMKPYQTKDTYRHPVVSAVTKAYITGEDEPVLLLVHHSTFITKKHDPDEVESLMMTNDTGYHGVKINGIHPNDEKCGITVKAKTFLLTRTNNSGQSSFKSGNQRKKSSDYTQYKN